MSQVVILNAGGQYCHLIARRIRELGVHATVTEIGSDIAGLRSARGIIISGGPASVKDPSSPVTHPDIYTLGIPILGICYGHQLMANSLEGGHVSRGFTKEYGRALFHRSRDSRLFRNIPDAPMTVWMSHGDTVVEVPAGFSIVGETDDCKVAAMEDCERNFFGLQFH